MRQRLLLLSFLISTLVWAVGCRGTTPTPDFESSTSLELSIAPNPPAVGEATLVVSLRDENGDPINGAEIDIRGDMNHAGMEPVLREVSESENGDYMIPFEWTMGGDWFIVVTATLPDGTVVERQFDYTVASTSDGGGGMDTGE